MKTNPNPPFTPLTDEARVPAYVLPELLPASDKIQDGMKQWPDRRNTLIDLFSDHVYGRTPAASPEGGIRVQNLSRKAAPQVTGSTRIQFSLAIGPPSNAHALQVVLYVPATAPTRCFLGCNFAGNHTIHPDPDIAIPQSWMYPWEGTGVENNRATAAGRGTRSRRWPVTQLLEAGCALATFYCGDLAPDQENHPRTADFKRLFPKTEAPQSAWGNIGIWAWGLSRVREALASLPDLSGAPCIAFGHSRMGKAALWAAAQDQKFAGAFSNCSGCMGAAISRRCFGETLDKITQSFPHWFCPRLRDWAGKEADMPLDQHMLLALIAPRPLFVASASEDLWADPRGEFQAALAASAAYALYGHAGLHRHDFPQVATPISGDRIGYFCGHGTHDLRPDTWEKAVAFFHSSEK